MTPIAAVRQNTDILEGAHTMTDTNDATAQLDTAARHLDALALGASPEDANRITHEMIAATQTGEDADRITAMAAEITARRNAMAGAQHFKPEPSDFMTPPAVSDKDRQQVANAILALPTATDPPAQDE